MNYSASTTWRSGVRLATSSLKKTIQSYRSLSQRLTAKLEQLMKKKGTLEDRAFVVLDEKSVELSDVSQHDDEDGPRRIPGYLSIQGGEESTVIQERLGQGREYFHNDDTALVSQATGILMESIKIRLSYIDEAIGQLTILFRENPKMKVPLELTMARYDEWVRTNQRLFELNSQLYDLEKRKFTTGRKKVAARRAESTREDVLAMSHHELHSNAQTTIHTLLARYRSFYSASSTTQAYLQEVLTYRGDRVTLEAQKVQEFVNECLQNSKGDIGSVEGAHPQNYQNFMAVLCNYIVERQRDIQGDEIPFSTVYNMVEHIVVPQIQDLLLRYVQDQEKDLRILEQCSMYKNITLAQLNVRDSFISSELEPFMESIAQLRASVFSPTPTGKMSAVVGAAKALYDQLGVMGEESIDGDSFLDLWIYVTLKACIPELATNIQFMEEYGNPSLNMDEAGYYLTTLNVAANFIERLSHDQLKKTAAVGDSYVVCEHARMMKIVCAMKNSCVELVQDSVELSGYRVAAIKDWVLDQSKLYSCVLMETGNQEDVAIVTVIRFSSEVSCASTVEFFCKKFTSPQSLCPALSPLTTPLGQAVTMDTQRMERTSYFFVPGGNFDGCRVQIEHVLHLIRLGSESTNIENTAGGVTDGCGQVDGGANGTDGQEFVYVFTPPQDGADDAGTHRQLLQRASSSEHERYRIHGNLQPTSYPEGDRRSTSLLDSSPSHAMDVSFPRRDSESIITPSPYLVSYSPRKEIGMANLPPSSPKYSSLLSNDDIKGKKIVRNRTVPTPEPPQSPQSLRKYSSLRSSVPDDDTPERSFLRHLQRTPKGEKGEELLSIPQIQVVVDMDINDQESMDTNKSMTLGSPVTEDRGALQVGGGVYLSASGGGAKTNADHYMALSVDPLAGGGDCSHETGRFVKSMDYHNSDKKAHRKRDYLSDDRASSRKSSVKRWTESLRQRFSYGGSRRRSRKNKEVGWEELEDSFDPSLTTPYQLNIESHWEEGEDRGNFHSISSSGIDAPSVSARHGNMEEDIQRASRRRDTVTVTIQDPGPEGFLYDRHVRKLEENFRANHLFGRRSVDLDEGMSEVVKQAQVFLQHLNYLTLATKVDGMYSDLTLLAVRKFQEAHNRHESQVTLKQDGRLTSVTSLFLRQAFITVYASLQRLGALVSLGDEIDPTSTRPDDVWAFRKCVQKFQVDTGVVCLCRGGDSGARNAGRKMGGVLCQHTIAKISEQISVFHY